MHPCAKGERRICVLLATRGIVYKVIGRTLVNITIIILAFSIINPLRLGDSRSGEGFGTLEIRAHDSPSMAF